MQNAITETYSEVEKLIHQQCWWYHGKTAVPIEDLQAQAGLSYCKAYRSYDPSRALFTTHLVNSIRYDFQTAARECNNEHQRLPRETEPVYFDKLPSKEHWDLGRFASELSEDAKTVIGLVVEAPDDLLGLLRLKNQHNLKAAVLCWLGDRFSEWGMGRINRTFTEIREALA